ncbi:outer membrane beta-barrel protein [Flavobacterium sp.]|uniref:outer membrane beta-barrel protein n=1 Tax=Flavobacterium sp. TaxID=239 RepID=UPI00286C9F02|nr:outer membrane beta-barrel protein [Flavobacterium sp.]
MKTTTTILKKNFFQIVGFCLLATYSANAQEGTTILPGTTFAGSADFYYKYDFAEVDNSYTSFTHSHDSYEIGMASIEASHKLGKASIFVDLGFGSRASEFTYNDAANTFMIKQMYITYDFTPSFKVTAGSFATHIGYELVDAVDNKNYSMSYAFTNGPFFNTGVKAQYTSGKYSFMAGITNPTDFKTTSDAGSKQKTFIGQIGYVADKGSAYLNFTSGSAFPASDKNKTQFDFVGSRKLNTKLTLGFNGTYAMVTDDNDSDLDANWFSLVGYLNYALKGKWSVAYRLEYFDDKDGAIYGAMPSIIGNTLSFNYKEGNFTFIPEVRFDSSSEDIFSKKDGSATGSSAYVLLATTYSF